MTARASTVSRGYGEAHKRERKRWEQRLAGGDIVPCARCGKPIRHGDTWDLGHTDDRTSWTGPECVSCNRSAGAKNSNQAQRSALTMTIREW